ncbi:hypothetical protein JCM21714_4286 [Gracilibacillus boraciitolerans JCM 21714]|uniref:VanZ-like domain-containing protein n=2 Tax=Gracilibacillus boraciitolerans TaxID=307521 RepID=W4VPE7_9BACI|nr:hypothetical protein JCM21714_4286 [Gracilibacillus boraciitolerans JCM 21714]
MWMGMIYYSSDQPYENQDIKPLLSQSIDLSFLEPYLQSIAFTYNHATVSVSELGISGFIEFFIRKGTHVGVFMVLCLLLFLCFYKTYKRVRWTFLRIYAFVFTLLYAIFDEWHQSWTPNRTPYAGDVLLDGFGGILAILLLLIIHKIKNDKPNKLRKEKINIV